ncbi:MAG: endonuclease MutS2, partial [Acidobacteria bacterium]|nr:endonuclease MutS2 [Acidobacteriota bacterium]
RFSLEVLEFPAVLGLLREYISGPLSEPLFETISPDASIAVIRRGLERAGEAIAYLRESPRPGMGALKNPRRILEKLAIEGVSLTAQEILALLDVARAARDFRPLFSKTPFTRLDSLARGLADFRSLLAGLDGKILPDGSLDSSASPALARIRRLIERRRQEVQSTLEKLLRRLGADKVLQDSVVTIRNERFVIPIRAEEKRRVPGVVHGASSSGATVYLEPLETLPLNNELVELQEREFAEVQRILAEFSARVRERRDELNAAADILSEIDLAFAKAEFARHYDCCLPEFAPGRALLLKDARHPLLERALRGQERKPVPLSMELAEPKTLMVVSGPNAGGKTVALKTLGITVLMAQAGLPVAAREARLPLYGRVLADIGDQQSIEANLSTFSAHVKNIQAMAEVAGREDLVLLDELGASTEPSEGAALAVAILEHFRERGAMTFVTTHHSRLKAYAAETPAAMNAAMEFDEATLQPTYRLLIGLPGKSSALDIAERLGLETSIVAKGRALLHPADAEAASLVGRLHEQRAEHERELAHLAERGRELEARRQSVEREFEKERRAKLRELDTRLEETLRQHEKRWQQALDAILAQAETAKARKRLERKTEALEKETREEWNAQVLETLGTSAEVEELAQGATPAVGDRVRVSGFSTPGAVIALLDAHHLEVEMGRLRMRVRKDEVQVLAPSKASPPATRAVELSPIGSRFEAPVEINVIGSSAEEARERVDKFLDDAFLAGRFRLRIVHGHGKGILRRVLHEMFASHPHVAKFYPAPQQEGGGGATIVELKV